MPKNLVFCILVWLGGFFAAGVTAGAPLAVITGSVGMLCTLAATAVRAGADAPAPGRHAGPVRGGG